MSQSVQLLHEPWPDRPRETEGYVFSMWLFLATEVLFFGALIAFYVVNRWAHPDVVKGAAVHTDFWFGTLNTAILLTSSASIAIADRALEHGLPRLSAAGLWLTLVFGLCFLVTKGFEYCKDLEDHLWPGPDFALLAMGARTFWGFYWIATAVHAVHVTIGLGLIGRLIVLSRRRMLRPRQASMTVTTLYWHFVDGVWVLLYALLYLVGRA
ncbi:MAG TPA: cytochrome c oxidase subunit 3 [Caulobacteraceae bacterium]|jgi:cytochrome c oxidase subunit 3|nr:cytochrome c oxidase subunit 3 [Caulobacteraceae bacterium]